MCDCHTTVIFFLVFCVMCVYVMYVQTDAGSPKESIEDPTLPFSGLLP